MTASRSWARATPFRAHAFAGSAAATASRSRRARSYRLRLAGRSPSSRRNAGETVVYHNVLDSLWGAQGAGATQIASDSPLLIRARTYNTAVSDTYLAARSIPEWKSKSAALAALATLALAIGISRLYLGVHWTSDVGAGFVAGLLWVTATTTGYELFRQYRLGQAEMAQRRAAASA
jgi:PAP2 superfamily